MIDKRQALKEKLILVSSEQRLAVMETRLKKIEDHLKLIAEIAQASIHKKKNTHGVW
jgi:hypothetical protein